jgi:hypothetical protein
MIVRMKRRRVERNEPTIALDQEQTAVKLGVDEELTGMLMRSGCLGKVTWLGAKRGPGVYLRSIEEFLNHTELAQVKLEEVGRMEKVGREKYERERQRGVRNRVRVRYVAEWKTDAKGGKWWKLSLDGGGVRFVKEGEGLIGEEIETRAAVDYGAVDKCLRYGLGEEESGYRPDAHEKLGAFGLLALVEEKVIKAYEETEGREGNLAERKLKRWLDGRLRKLVRVVSRGLVEYKGYRE